MVIDHYHYHKQNIVDGMGLPPLNAFTCELDGAFWHFCPSPLVQKRVSEI